MAARKTRRQLQFTGFEMALIGVSFVVSITAVFFLGLFVGKKNASYHAPGENRVARIPVDDFARYKRPGVVESGSVAAAAAEPEATKTKAVATESAAKAAKPATETAKRDPEPAKKDAAAATRDAEVARSAASRAKAVEEAAAAATRKKEAEATEAATGRGYTVQLLATRKQGDAEALVRKLKTRGYAAYVKKVSDGAGSWYRVRVGSYGAFSEARVMADRCRRELGLGQAFVSTE